MQRMRRILSLTCLPVMLCLLGSGMALAQGARSSQQTSTSSHDASASSHDASASSYDASALDLLQKMVDSYAHLSALEQRSEYTSSHTPLGSPVAPKVQNSKVQSSAAPGSVPSHAVPSVPSGSEGAVSPRQDDPGIGQRIDRKVTLCYAQPNYLKLEDASTHAADRSQWSYWICDGKSFWAYVPNAHGSTGKLRLYTQEKAPRRLQDFVKLQHFDPGSLELLMLMGINPFHDLKEDVASVQDQGVTTVRGTPAEVISIVARTATERTEVHLYIDKSDYLLLRLSTDMIPVSAQEAQNSAIDDVLTEMEQAHAPPPPANDNKNNSNKNSNSGDVNQVADANPDNFLGSPATDRPQALQKLHVSYDNIIDRSPYFQQETFVFTPPANAGLFVPVGSKVVTDPKAHRLIDLIRRGRNGKVKSIRPTKPVHEVAP